MKKRIVSALLVIVMLVTVLPMTALAAEGLSNFKEVKTYYNGLFKDVPSSQWYAPYVELAYEYGLVNGKTANTYEPNSNLTIAEAIKLAACLNSIYYDGTANFQASSPWYQTYVDYALYYGIIYDDYPNYNAPATRAQFAEIFANALPYTALPEVNTVYDNAIPDVYMSDTYSWAVYALYRAGILTGSDSKGTFNPNSNIKRSEVATIVARMANVTYRKSVTLTNTADPKIKAESTSITVPKGGQKSVLVTDVTGDGYGVDYDIANESIVSCSWGDWLDFYTLPLFINGLTAGSTTITIHLLDSYGYTIATTSIYVTVSSTGVTTTYYSGFYPVPDYGAYYDAPVYDSEVGYDYAFYYYKLSDLPASFDEYFYGYGDLLEQNGFVYYAEYLDYYGYETLNYYHSAYGLDVYFGPTDVDGVPCFVVEIYYY